MDTKNTSRQFRYLEEVRIPLHRAGFETLPLEGAQLPVLWNGAPLCRITGKGSVASMTISGRKVFRCSLTAIYKSRTKGVNFPAAEKFS